MKIYTDGGCTNNPKHKNHKHGGWAFLVIYKNEPLDFECGEAHDTTSNIMELTAIIKALRWVQANNITFPIVILSDSQYCVRGYNEWLKGWIDRQWYSSTGKPVANQDQWKQLSDLKSQLPFVTLKWIKGHDGNQWNEMVDQLTWEARKMNN